MNSIQQVLVGSRVAIGTNFPGNCTMLEVYDNCVVTKWNVIGDIFYGYDEVKLGVNAILQLSVEVR